MRRFLFLSMRRFVTMCALLLSATVWLGCSSEDEVAMDREDSALLFFDGKEDGQMKPGDRIQLINEVTALIQPISYNDAPAWLKPIIANEEKGLANKTVCRANWNGKIIYNFHSDLMSVIIGEFLDENGERLEVQSDKLFYEATDWVCIVYFRYY